MIATVDRYLAREVLGPFLAGWLILTGVFAAYAAAGVLADAALGELSPIAVWRLIGLRCLIAAEVIVPTALFFAVLFAFERLNRDRELVVMMAGGFSRLRLLLPILGVALLMLVLVAVLALQTRPWAYRYTYWLEDLASRPDVASMQAGRFYRMGPDLVVTARTVSDDGSFLSDVFARQERAGGLRLIRAERARLSPTDESGAQLVEFEDGQSLMVLADGGGGDRRHRFDSLRFRWDQGGITGDALNRRARETGDLFQAERAKDVAELQWRFTLPWITFGMTLVAGVLGTFRPGSPTALRLLVAIGSYIVVFNIAAAARSGLENGTLPAVPGIWWVPALPLLLAFGFLVLMGRRT